MPFLPLITTTLDNSIVRHNSNHRVPMHVGGPVIIAYCFRDERPIIQG